MPICRAPQDSFEILSIHCQADSQTRGPRKLLGLRKPPPRAALVIGGEMRENGCSVTFRLPKQNYRDIERIIEFDFVRATEAAALNSLRWLGRGDKEAADAAACDAMRGMFDLMNICGEVVIGEGIKDEAPGIFKGEQLGTWLPGAPQFRHRDRSNRRHHQHLQRRAELDQLYRGGESGRGRKSGAARCAIVLHVETGLWAARDRLHEETRRFA